MTEYSNYAAEQLTDLIERYNGFRTQGEYGVSAFWNWYYQVRNYVNSIEATCEQNSQYAIYQMPYWGKIIYSCTIVEGEWMVYIHEFKFRKKNFKAWLLHKEIVKESVKISESQLRQIIKESIKEILKKA